VKLELTYRSPAAFLAAYTTQMVKGALFVETAAPPAAGTPVALRLVVPPDTEVTLAGQVAWTRAAAPRQPAGTSIALPSLSDALGAAVDGVARRYAGIWVLLRTSEAAPRAILSRYLRSIAGCEIVELDDEAGADAFLARLDVSVIDLDGAGPAGFELCARLRAHPRAASSAVLALAQLERDRARALRAGFDDALANPPAFADLEASLLRALARPKVKIVE
jgi:uncharacterized protein (TIGR02266 family)